MLQAIRGLPALPGVYQYFDRKGKLLYVGKAKVLSSRVKSYWRFTLTLHPSPNVGARISKMLHEAVSLETIITQNEADALILENSLIKQLKPKYNILLRDDKTYPYICINESEDFPRFELTRKVLNSRLLKGKQISYYGPFPTGGKALLDALYEIYPLVQKKSGLDRGEACLFHQIGKCLAPCENKVSRAKYHSIVTEAKQSIHKRTLLITKLQERMQSLALQERFEEAAKMRDRIEAIKTLTLRSGIDLATHEDYDIFAIHNGEQRGVVVRLFMRRGKIISSDHTFFNKTEMFDNDEAYRQALLSHYTTELPFTPKTILVAHDFETRIDVASVLSSRLGKTITLHHPKRGNKHALATLSLTNAEELLRQNRNRETSIEKEIATLLELPMVPYRVEVFDNSHMMGSATVGAMVVWSEGAWEKGSYRRYELTAKDEYGQMQEMLERRITSFDTTAPPDIWLLDGGQANLNLARTLLNRAGVNLDVIAIAKAKLDSKAHRAKGAAKDLLYAENGIIKLKPSDKRLQWLQRLRDESHRFAISYHQNRKRRDDRQVSLLTKKGIGEATVKKLINYFGTFERISEANHDEITAATNKSVADILCE